MNPRAFAAIFGLSILMVGPTALWSRDTVAGGGVDLPGTIWIHWWIRWCVEHAHLPVTTDLLFYPDGKNFFNDTGANYVDALLGVPLQWAFGSPDFLDFLNVVILVGNGVAVHLLIDDVTERAAPWATLAGTVAFLLSPFCLLHLADGRPTQLLLWFAILGVRHALRLADGDWRQGALFGLCTALQAWTYWYTAYFTAIALLPVVLVQVARSPRNTLFNLSIAVGITFALCGPALLAISQEIAAGNVHRVSYADWREAVSGPVDQVNVDWDQAAAAHPARWRTVLGSFQRAYILILVLLAFAAGRRAAWLLLGAGLGLWFAFGGRMESWDNPPYVLLWQWLPLLKRLGFPDRILAWTYLFFAAAGAITLARVDRVWSWLFIVVALGEAMWRNDAPVNVSRYRFPPATQRVAAEGGAVVHVPLFFAEVGMVYQTRYGQPMLGGMGEHEDDLRPGTFRPRIEQNGFLTMLFATATDTEVPIPYTLEERAAVAAQYRWVWLDRRYAPAAWRNVTYSHSGVYARFVTELGPPAVVDNTHALWDLHAELPTNTPSLLSTAPRTGAELGRLIDAGAGPGAELTLRPPDAAPPGAAP